MNNKTYITITVIVILLCGLIGFLAGRKSESVPTEPVIKYLPGETVTKVIEIEKPILIIPPLDTLNIIEQAINKGIFTVPVIVDSIYIPTKVDTMQILSDWATKRIYDEELFNADSLGTCSINIGIQYNRLDSLSYSFTPVIKEVTNTIYKIPTVQPFISTGIEYPLGAYVGGGLIIKGHWGAEASLGINTTKDLQGRIGILYAF